MANNKKVSIILVPHGDARPRSLRISKYTIWMLLILGLGMIVGAGFIIAQHIDYKLAQHKVRQLRNRMAYYDKQMNETLDLVEKLKQNDAKLRRLLGLKTKQEIIRHGNIKEQPKGTGGPTPRDEAFMFDLTRPEGLGNYLQKVDQLLGSNLEQFKKEATRLGESFTEVDKYLVKRKALLVATPQGWPVFGWITSGFGWRKNPFDRAKKEFHKGIDIANDFGTLVYATAPGRVTYTGWAGGYGKLVIINHGYGYTTLYAHLKKITVRRGQRIVRGEVVGLVGSTGRSTGPHLYYEVRLYGKPINPWRFL